MTQLRAVAPGLWCVESHFKVWGCNGSARMSVIGTQDGLILYSPVALDNELVAAIAALGPLRAIVAPNLYHHLYLRNAAAVFPDARVLVPRGLEAKIGVITRAEIMTDETVFALSNEIDHFIFAGHAIRETSLFHHPSGTLITADLLYNLQAEQFPAERAFFRLIGSYGRPAVPFYHRFAINERVGVRRLIDTVRRWPVRRIVPCHGRIVERADASEIFATAWSRFA